MSIEAWIASAAAAVSIYAVYLARRDRSTDAMDDKFQDVDEIQRSHARDIARLSLGQATMQQQMDDHEKHDDARFSDIGEMFKEIRADLKALLRGARTQ